MAGVVTFVVTRRGMDERKTANSLRISGLWWCHQESNRGHKDFQSFALPTELWHLLLGSGGFVLAFGLSPLLLRCKVRHFFSSLQIFLDFFWEKWTFWPKSVEIGRFWPLRGCFLRKHGCLVGCALFFFMIRFRAGGGFTHLSILLCELPVSGEG